MLKCCFTWVECDFFAIFKDPQFAENPKTRDQSNIQIAFSTKDVSEKVTYLKSLS